MLPTVDARLAQVNSLFFWCFSGFFFAVKQIIIFCLTTTEARSFHPGTGSKVDSRSHVTGKDRVKTSDRDCLAAIDWVRLCANLKPSNPSSAASARRCQHPEDDVQPGGPWEECILRQLRVGGKPPSAPWLPTRDPRRPQPLLCHRFINDIRYSARGQLKKYGDHAKNIGTLATTSCTRAASRFARRTLASPRTSCPLHLRAFRESENRFKGRSKEGAEHRRSEAILWRLPTFFFLVYFLEGFSLVGPAAPLP